MNVLCQANYEVNIQCITNIKQTINTCLIFVDNITNFGSSLAATKVSNNGVEVTKHALPTLPVLLSYLTSRRNNWLEIDDLVLFKIE